MKYPKDWSDITPEQRAEIRKEIFDAIEANQYKEDWYTLSVDLDLGGWGQRRLILSVKFTGEYNMARRKMILATPNTFTTEKLKDKLFELHNEMLERRKTNEEITQKRLAKIARIKEFYPDAIEVNTGNVQYYGGRIWLNEDFEPLSVKFNKEWLKVHRNNLLELLKLGVNEE